MSNQGAPVTPTNDPKILRRKAGNHLVWAIIFWVAAALTAIYFLGHLAGFIAQGYFSNGYAGYALASLVIPFVILAVCTLAALAFTRNRRPFLAAAERIEQEQYAAWWQQYGQYQQQTPATPGYPLQQQYSPTPPAA